jgi:hypothetical protein
MLHVTKAEQRIISMQQLSASEGELKSVFFTD